MNSLSTPGQRYKWWVELSLCQDIDPGDCTTNHWGFSPWKFIKYSIQGGVSSNNACLLEMGDMLDGAAYIWKYLWSTMSWRYVNDLQSHFHCYGWYSPQRRTFPTHLVIGMIPVWICPVEVSDVNISLFLLDCQTIESVKSHVQINICAKHSVILSISNTCCIIPQLCHTLSTAYCPLQLHSYAPLC